MTAPPPPVDRPGEKFAIEAAIQAAADMAFDWACPVNPNRNRYECRQCVAKIAVAAAYPIIAAALAESIAAEWNEFRRIGQTPMRDLSALESRQWDRNAAVVGDVLDAGSKLDIAAWVRFAAAARGVSE